MLVAGGAFAVGQYVTSNFISIPLSDIVASLASVVATVAFLRIWSPAETYVERELATVGGGARGDDANEAPGSTGRVVSGAADDSDVVDSRTDVVRAYAPYVIIVAVFSVAQISAIKDALAKVATIFNWPGLHITSASGTPSTLPTFTFSWISAAGSLLIVAGLITIPVLGISPVRAARAYVDTYRQLATAIVTVMAVLALAYVMNASGQTITLGTWMAGAGGLFAVISPLLGWLGVAVTGSDTSSNSLFGALQVAAANHAHLSPTLLAAANSSGGVLGKMISPQNLAIGAGAVGMSGQEGDLFRRVLGWSVLFVLVMAALVYLQSTSVLSWMVP
jgi:lactate permease